MPPDELLALHGALDQLAVHDPVAAELVKVHCFAGLSVEEAASVLGYAAGPPYTDPSLGVGTVVKRLHVEELRQRIRTIAG